MKKNILVLLPILLMNVLYAQNVDDNKVNFPYVQLPLKKINPQFTAYEVRVNHLYKNANNDSIAVYNARKEAAQKAYDAQYNAWVEQKKVIDRNYYAQMAQYEKNLNAGIAATMPLNPVFPAAPLPVSTEKVRLHTEIADADISNGITIQGFEKGLGGFIVTVDLHPIRAQKIIETKTGSGASTKYEYKCQYILPVEVTVDSPTDGQLYKKILFDNVQYYTMKSFPSKYDYLSWYMDNADKFFLEMEAAVRKSAITEVNGILNDQFGFVKTTRSTEVYSVKKYKDYEYSDVITAFTVTTQAYTLVGKDRNRSGAVSKIDEAISKWKVILQESNLADEKARVNDKITAMIQCNLAELCLWKGDFDQAEIYLNLALNSGVMKFRNQAERMQPFFRDQRARWEANYK